MVSVPVKSKTPHTYKHQSGNSTRITRNYYDVAKAIPTVYPALPFDKSEEWHWEFSSACMHFLVMQDELPANVDDCDSIGALVDTLINAIHKLNYIIEVEEDEVHFLDYIPCKDLNLGISLQWIKEVEENPLQIAMAHILKAIETSVDFNLDASIFESTDDSEDCYPYSFYYYIEEGDEELTKKQRRAEVRKFKNRGLKLFTLMDELAKQSLDSFYNYNPRKQKNKELKEILKSLLEYNPNRIRTFGQFGNPEHDTGDYRQHFGLYVDTSLDFDNSLRREQVQMMWETGFCYLATRTTFEKGKFREEHTIKDVQDFQQYEELLLSLTERL